MEKRSGMLNNKFITVQEAAEFLEVSRAKVSTMLKHGELKAVINPLNRRQKLIEVDQLTRFKGFLSDNVEETAEELEDIRQAFKEGEAEMKAGTLYSLDDILERAARILASSEKFSQPSGSKV
jgi:excisionase family DNA binding protein